MILSQKNKGYVGVMWYKCVGIPKLKQTTRSSLVFYQFNKVEHLVITFIILKLNTWIQVFWEKKKHMDIGISTTLSSYTCTSSSFTFTYIGKQSDEHLTMQWYPCTQNANEDLYDNEEKNLSMTVKRTLYMATQ